MCGSTKAPKVVERDPVAEAKAAELVAANDANSGLALRRKQRTQNSLLTMGPQGIKPMTNTPYNLLGAAPDGTAQPGKKPVDMDKLGYPGRVMKAFFPEMGQR